MKVLGVAPGANVDVMKVFGANNVSFTSEILQGIDWAIQHDHADILSISFGSTPVPNTAAGQPLTAILKNAMSDGIVVVASTGDSSPSNTEGSPALDPGVIGAAASTSYRLIAQTNVYLYDLAQAIHNGSGTPSYQLGQSTPGWLDNEVSTLSSSGVTEDRRVPDLIAPGDLNWADCSTDTSAYTDCANYARRQRDRPPGLRRDERVGPAHRRRRGARHPGVPGVAQRQTRRRPPSSGRSSSAARPTSASPPRTRAPACSTRCAAVQLAKSYGSNAKGGGLLHSPDNLADLGKPGASFRHTVKVTNTGAARRRSSRCYARSAGRTRSRSGKLNLFWRARGRRDPAPATPPPSTTTGETIPELNCKTFKVPKGVDLLDSRIGWNPLQPCASCTAGEPTAREILIDPKGRYGQYSDPQGDGSGFADEQIHQPAAGKWTLLLFGRATSNYEGAVSYEETAQTLPDRQGRGQAGLEGRRSRQVGLVHRQGAGPGQARLLDRARSSSTATASRSSARSPSSRRRRCRSPRRRPGTSTARSSAATAGPECSRRSSATSSRCRRASTTWT